ncbi:hypothetical protein ACIOHC_11010 [Streptomyces sp. NPDC088252]|uniref:hypothetical protein n=1 Tax=unclassified Streptomyces TaxID=2593676 RepID=UPI003808A2AF
MIRIRPAHGRRTDFARWAVAQRPKVDTVSVYEFGVPARLFVEMPEDILTGALVDGHRYVSPDEDAAEGRPAPGAELLGVAAPDLATVAAFEAQQLGEQEAVVGGALPEVPASAYGPDSVPLAPAETEDPTTFTDPAGSGAGDDNGQDGPLPCPDCSRTFTTARGRDSHRRQIHPEA